VHKNSTNPEPMQNPTKENESQALKHVLRNVIVHIRFPMMSPNELLENVEPFKDVIPKYLLAEAYKFNALAGKKLPEFEGDRFKNRCSNPFLVFWHHKGSSTNKKRKTTTHPLSADEKNTHIDLIQM